VKIHEVKRLLKGGLLLLLGISFSLMLQIWLHPILVSLGIVAQISMYVVAASKQWRLWFLRPTFFTRRGVAVWTNGLPVTKGAMEMAEERFISVLTREASQFVTEGELWMMLRHTGIEWTKKAVHVDTGCHDVWDQYGIQHGYRLEIRWSGTVLESPLYHELLHEVNETIRLPKIQQAFERACFREQDCRHSETDWWKLEKTLMGVF